MENKILTIIASILLSLYAAKGGVRHYVDIKSAQLQEIVMLNWLSQCFCILAFPTGKISVAILIGRLMGPSKWRRYFLYFLSVAVLVVAIVCLVVVLAQCSPTRALWDPSAGKCWNPKISLHYFLFFGSTYTFSFFATLTMLTFSSGFSGFADLSLALLPITIIWNLQLSLRRRISICLLLGFGVL